MSAAVDYGPTLRAALASGEPVHLPAGTYTVYGNIDVTSAARISGDGGAFRYAKTRLKLVGGSLRIVSNGGDAAQPSGSGTRITDLAIEGDPQHAGPLVEMAATATLERCYLLRSGGDAVFINGVAPGNVNGWRLSSVWVEDCAGWGVRVAGSDSQAAVAEDVHVVTSGGGFWDGSFLGCTWVGCHAEYCGELGGYLCDSPSGRAVFVGCYCEMDSWARSWIGHPATVIGGTLAAAVAGMPTFSSQYQQHRAWWLDGGVAGGMTWESASGARRIRTQAGMPADGRTVLAWQDRSASGGDPHDFGLISDDAGKAYWIARGRSSNNAAFGWTRAGHALGYDQALAPNGVHVGKRTARGKTLAVVPTVPDAADGAEGDCVMVIGASAQVWRKQGGAWSPVQWVGP
jgi:hypothetical protein